MEVVDELDYELLRLFVKKVHLHLVVLELYADSLSSADKN
jgi:hypothetical protein